MEFATRAIHVGQEPDPSTGAVTVPIFATSTYVQEAIGKNKGYEYARVSNPTRTRLEQNLAALEGGTSAHVFASGMAAITAMLTMMIQVLTESMRSPPTRARGLAERA